MHARESTAMQYTILPPVSGFLADGWQCCYWIVVTGQETANDAKKVEDMGVNNAVPRIHVGTWNVDINVLDFLRNLLNYNYFF